MNVAQYVNAGKYQRGGIIMRLIFFVVVATLVFGYFQFDFRAFVESPGVQKILEAVKNLV